MGYRRRGTCTLKLGLILLLTLHLLLLSSCLAQHDVPIDTNIETKVVETKKNISDQYKKNAIPPELWEESPVFTIEGKSMIGVENKISVLFREDIDLYTNVANKIMWHLWSEQDLIGKSFSVVGIHKESNSVEKVLFYTDKNQLIWETHNSIMGPIHGADAHIPSVMLFSKPGLWCLNAYSDGQLFGQIIIRVLDKGK